MTHRTVAAALLAIGVSAACGGIGLLTGTVDPGSALIDGSVFASYFWPGMVLALIVGGSAICAGIALAIIGWRSHA